MDESVIRHTRTTLNQAPNREGEVNHELGGGAVGGGGEVSDLETVVECPVCLVIPRDLPIPCCPAGHIVCRPCRGRVLHCPTCRRQLGDNTSSLAAALIERVKHKCQYSEYGCEYKQLLSHIVRHEEVCPVRLVSCPPPNGCQEKVLLKEYHKHAVMQGCSVEMRNFRTKFNLSKDWMKWDGVSARNSEEFNLTEDLAWTFFHFSKFHQQFYLSAQYYASEKLFLFYVMVIGGQEVAEDFRAKISIANEDHSIKIEFQGPVLAVDRIPSSEKKLLLSGGCWCVHYRAIRNLLTVTEVGDNRRGLAWSVDFTTDVDVQNVMAVS